MRWQGTYLFTNPPKTGSNKNNYANVDLIVQVAEREGVDAVWPGCVCV
jgi:biotin carboxylase